MGYLDLRVIHEAQNDQSKREVTVEILHRLSLGQAGLRHLVAQLEDVLEKKFVDAAGEDGN